MDECSALFLSAVFCLIRRYFAGFAVRRGAREPGHDETLTQSNKVPTKFLQYKVLFLTNICDCYCRN